MVGSWSTGSWFRNGNRDCNTIGSHVGSTARSEARSVALSLMTLKNPGAGAEPNGNRVRR